jgi:zinc protease
LKRRKLAACATSDSGQNGVTMVLINIQHRRIKVVAALLLALGLGMPSGTKVDASTSTGPGNSHEVRFKQLQLDNGLRVVLSEDHVAPVVAVVLYYDVGSRNEVKGRTGFAHLFEHMMFQGSENIGKGEYFKYVEHNGGLLNGTTHVDYTDFYEFMPSNQLEIALWLESDRMRSLKITPENLKNQQEAVKEEKRLSIDNQAYWPSLEKLDQLVFHNWALAHPTIGSMQDLDAATVADVKDFFDTYYAPNNAVLAVSGDIDYGQAEALVRKYFGTIPRHKAPPAVDQSEPFEVVKQSEVMTDPHAEMPAVAMEWKTPARRSPDSYAVALLRSILVGGDSSRLQQKLVKDSAVSLQVQGFLEERRVASDASVLTIHKPDVKPEEVRSLIEAEIDRIRKEGIQADELTTVKNQYRLNRFLGRGEDSASLQTALGRAMGLAEFTMFDGDPSLMNTEIDRYLAVTADQIKRAAIKYFGTANRTVLFIRPASDGTGGKQERRGGESQ